MTTDTRALRVLTSVLVNTGSRAEGRPVTIFAALTDAELAEYQRGAGALDDARIVHIVMGGEPTEADRRTAAERFASMGNG